MALAVLGMPAVITVFPGWVWALGVIALVAPGWAHLLAFGASAAAAAFLTVPLWVTEARGPLSMANVGIAELLGAAMGGLMLWLAFRTRRAGTQQAIIPSAGAIALTSGVAVASLAPYLRYTTALEINQAMRLRPAAGAVLLGLAALLLLRRERSLKLMASVLAILALVPSALASEWFRRSEVRDLLFIASADIEWREAPNAPSRKWPLQKRVTALSLSPSGTAFIGSNWFDKTSVVGSDAGIRRAHAYPVRFIDDTRVLGIFHGSDRTELRMQELGEAWGEPRWHVSLPGLNGLEVDVVSPDGTWQVSAPWGETRKVLQGAIGDDAIKEEIWNANAGDGVTRIRTSPSGSGDLLVQSVGSPHRHPEHGGWDEPLPSTDPGHSTQLWLAGPAGRPERRLANTKFRCRVYATRTNRRLVLVPRLRSLGVLRLGDRTRAADSDTNDPWARGPDRGCRRCLRRFNDAGVPVGRPRPARRCSVSSLRPTVASIRRRRHGRGGAWRDRDCRSGTGDPLRLPASLGSLSGSL